MTPVRMPRSSFVIWGRLYLGMHSPIDVVTGYAFAVVLLMFYIPVEDFFEAWMTGSAVIPYFQTCFAVVLCWTYPKPLRPTPSYNYAVYFTAVCWGLVIGIWRRPDFHSLAAASAMVERRGSLLSWTCIQFVGVRFVVGVVLVLVLRAIAKEVAKVVIPLLFKLCRIPYSDYDQFYDELAAKEGGKLDYTRTRTWPEPPGYNVLTGVRFLTYGVVGWAVSEGAYQVFAWLGI
jgi:hypothetical protein